MNKAPVEGPLWMGRWTEFTVEALKALGYEVDVVFSNVKTLGYRAARLAEGLGLADSKRYLDRHYNQLVLQMLRAGGYRYYVSVAGKLDYAALQRIRSVNREVKVIFWIGDRFADHIEERFWNLYQGVGNGTLDAIAFAELATAQRLQEEGMERIFSSPSAWTKAFMAVSRCRRRSGPGSGARSPSSVPIPGNGRP